MTRVLVIDDDAAIREITQLALEASGFEVRTAPTGQHALAIAAREAVDAIVLDVRMPVMDGAEFTRRYRSATARPAPIIVLTAARDSGDHERVDASRYIEKPFDLDDLVRVINEVTATAA